MGTCLQDLDKPYLSDDIDLLSKSRINAATKTVSHMYRALHSS